MDKGIDLGILQPNALFRSDELTSFRSDYLSGGWNKDKLVLNYVRTASEGIYLGNFSVTNYFVPSDGVFHFTVPLAFICVAQLAIIGACLDLRLTTKPGEVLLRRIDIKCRNSIHMTEGIEVSLKLHNRLFLDQIVYYEGAININNEDFIGTGSFVIPLPANYSVK